MKKLLFTKWYAKYLILLACIGVLLVVPLLRDDEAGWVGSDSYLNYRLAEDPSMYDDLSFGGRFAAYEWGTPLVMSLAPNLLISVLPFVFGILTFILVWLIIKKLYQNKKIEKLAMILFLLSPTFVYLFSFGNSLFIPTFFCVLAFYLFIQDKHSWLSVPLILVLPFFNIILLASLMICMFFYAFFQDKKKKNLFFILLVFGLIVSIAYYGFIFSQTGLPHQLDLNEGSWTTFLQKWIYDFGSEYGIGLFLLTLSVIGMAYMWKKKYDSLFLFFSVLGLLIFSFFRMEVLIILNIFLCVLGASGIEFFLDKKRTGAVVYTLIIIICGVVFSGISQLDNLTESVPTEGMVAAMDYLETREKGVVFSDYERGVYINYAGHKNFIDENYLFVQDAGERFEIANELYYYRNLEDVETVCDEYDIKYIWIDQEMKDELWEYDTEGLLFILEYTRDFIKIYDKEGVEIWIKEDLD